MFRLNKKAISCLLILLMFISISGCAKTKTSYAAVDLNEQLALAVKYITSNNYDKAVLALETAIQIDPKFTPAYKSLSTVYMMKGEIDKAKDILDQGIDIADKPNELRVELASLYYLDKNYKSVANIFDFLMEDNYLIEDEQLLFKMAYAYGKSGNFNKAINFMEKGLSEYQSEQFNAGLADLYANNGETEKSLSIIEKMLDKNNNMGEIYLILNQILRNEASYLTVDKWSLNNPDTALGNIIKITTLKNNGKYKELIEEYGDSIQASNNLKLRLYLVEALYNNYSRGHASDILYSINYDNIDDPYMLTDLAAKYFYFNNNTIADEILEKVVGEIEDTSYFYERIVDEYGNDWRGSRLLNSLEKLIKAKTQKLLKEGIIEYIKASVDFNLKFNITQIDTSKSPIITSYFSVTDYFDKPIDEEISPNKLSFLNNNKLVYGDFSKADNKWTKVPIQIVLAIDVSGSMKGEPIKQAKIAANQVVDLMNHNTKIGIVTFGGGISVLSKLTADKFKLYDAINQIDANGGTPLYHGTIEAINLLDDTFGRKIVIVMADGDNNEGGYIEDVLEVAKEDNVTIYSIGLGNLDPDDLMLMADATGGIFLETPSANELGILYEQVLSQVKSEYKFTFIDNSRKDNANESSLFEIFYSTPKGTVNTNKYYLYKGWY